MTAPARVRAQVRHRRTRPFAYGFAHGTTMWLVDAGDPNAAFPRWLRPFASIRSEDHFAPGDARPLPAKIRTYLDAQRVPWTAHRVLMLANARSLGYVFDPLTTYFCFDADGDLEGVLAEVHNTYGERHCYALRSEPEARRAQRGVPEASPAGAEQEPQSYALRSEPEARRAQRGVPEASPAGAEQEPQSYALRSELEARRAQRGVPEASRASVDKEFYVSPFFAVEGRYDIRTRLTDAQVLVAISLTQDDRTVFTASVVGDLTRATRATTLAAVARDPLPSHRVSALIRWHGIRLWLRRLPVVARRPHQAPKGMAPS